MFLLQEKKRRRKSLEVTVKFMMLFMVTVLQIYAYLQTHQNTYTKNRTVCMSIISQLKKNNTKTFFISNCDNTVMTTLSCDGIDHPNTHCSID